MPGPPHLLWFFTHSPTRLPAPTLPPIRSQDWLPPIKPQLTSMLWPSGLQKRPYKKLEIALGKTRHHALHGHGTVEPRRRDPMLGNTAPHLWFPSGFFLLLGGATRLSAQPKCKVSIHPHLTSTHGAHTPLPLSPHPGHGHGSHHSESTPLPPAWQQNFRATESESL